ncbi:MAG: hypothetical protein K0R48_966 [Gammaproteobacteria bacterium]|jgi:hypothetical protein|nr:hypothetical protein [Gammaproteobacteria bacterium]
MTARYSFNEKVNNFLAKNTMSPYEELIQSLPAPEEAAAYLKAALEELSKRVIVNFF